VLTQRRTAHNSPSDALFRWSCLGPVFWRSNSVLFDNELSKPRLILFLGMYIFAIKHFNVRTASGISWTLFTYVRGKNRKPIWYLMNRLITNCLYI
jgi:hypothetical protein